MWALLLLVVSTSAATVDVCAQAWEDRRDRGLLALEQAVRDARSDTQVLLVASHPDDRYVMPAAWLRFRHGIRVAVLLATRGEGGQNAWGPETGAALGRIRTREAEACAARLGIDLYYLNAPDRGFTRTAAEAQEQWNRKRTTEDIARVVRVVRPDIVMTTHHSRETHGHDLALLEMLPAAVDLAASRAFDVDGLPPIEVDRLFVGRPPTLAGVDSEAVILDMDEIEPVRGRTFRHLAYDAMTTEHRSQQPYLPMAELFDSTVPLVAWPTRSGSGGGSLLGGLPTFWELLPPPRSDRDRIDRTAWGRLFDVNLGGGANRQSQTRAALDLIAALRSLRRDAGKECRLRIDRRLEALQRVVLHSMSILFEADVEGEPVAVSGEQLEVALRLFKGSEPHADTPVEPIRFEALGDCRLDLFGGDQALSLGDNRSLTVRGAVQIPASWANPDSPIDRLYREGRFTSPVRIRCTMTIAGQEISTMLALPVTVRGPVELESIPNRLLLTSERPDAVFRVRIRRNTRQPVETRLRIKAPPGFVVLGQPLDVSMAVFEPEKLITDLSLRVPVEMDAPVRVLLADLADQALRIPVHRVDVRVPPSLTVGLVQGQDDATKSVLSSLLGERLRLLDADDVLEDNLAVFDTIVVDVRAGPRIRGAFHRLLEFARLRGKRLVVFHHKPGEFNREESGYVGFPYSPFLIGRGRVTQEDAPVRVLAPEHPVLSQPNRIGPEDWDGWEHERGLYFPKEFGSDYTPLLSMQDQGVPGAPERGALLHARYGEGEYVYCALSLYRQLKNLHPGAVRLLANLMTPAAKP